MGLLAKVLIPTENKPFLMGFNQGVQCAEFGATEATGFDQFNEWFKPKLGVAFGLLNVDVPGFLPLAAEKEEAKAVQAKDFWHGCTG